MVVSFAVTSGLCNLDYTGSGYGRVGMLKRLDLYVAGLALQALDTEHRLSAAVAVFRVRVRDTQNNASLPICSYLLQRGMLIARAVEPEDAFKTVLVRVPT